jgi:hypothetical protein
MINEARDATQTHIEFEDLLERLPFQGWEPMTATTSRTVAKTAKRRMG